MVRVCALNYSKNSYKWWCLMDHLQKWSTLKHCLNFYILNLYILISFCTLLAQNKTPVAKFLMHPGIKLSTSNNILIRYKFNPVKSWTDITYLYTFSPWLYTAASLNGLRHPFVGSCTIIV